jgi:hypothetical protein
MVDYHNSSDSSNRIESVDARHGSRSTTAGIVDDGSLAPLESEIFVYLDARIATRYDDETSFSGCSDLLADVA